LGFIDAVPGGDATTPKIGDLSGAVTAGSTNADTRITNTGDTPCSFNWRDTGTTPFYQKSLLPLESVDIKIALTAARTFEYFFDASTLQVDVTYFWGTGLSSTVTLSDVTAWLVAHGYTISASGDLTSAQVQLFLDDITSEVTPAASIWNAIRSQTLDAGLKNRIILKGTIAQALFALRNKGASSGLSQNRIIVDSETANNYQAYYERKVDDMLKGNSLGA